MGSVGSGERGCIFLIVAFPDAPASSTATGRAAFLSRFRRTLPLLGPLGFPRRGLVRTCNLGLGLDDTQLALDGGHKGIAGALHVVDEGLGLLQYLLAHLDDGNVWITDGRSANPDELKHFPDSKGKGHTVVKFSPEGKVLLTLGTPGVAGDPPQALTEPNDVVTAANGDIFIAEGHGGQNAAAGPTTIARIVKYSRDGKYITSWGKWGKGPGEFRTPHSLAMDSQGRLFVADRGNNRIQIFDSSYQFVDEWRQFGRPNDIFIDVDDTMYVVDAESGDERNPGVRRGIYIGSARDGTVTNYIEPHPSPREQDAALGTMGEGIAVDASGNIYVGEVALSGMTMFMTMGAMAH